MRKIKLFFTYQPIDRLLSLFTKDKGINNLFVKMLPSNLDYKATAIRRKTLDGITYDLYLNQWMEYALYFEIKDERKSDLYDNIKPGFTIIDVGVNFGETLLNFAKLTSDKGFVFGFEPVPNIYKKCLHNLSLNSFKNVTLENYALSDHEEILLINDPLNGNSGGTYVSKDVTSGSDKITIAAIVLDKYVQQKKIDKIDFIKIDVEGYETSVLKGAYNAIKKFKPILFIEVCDENLKRAGSSAIELIQLLCDLNYNVKCTYNGQMMDENNIGDFQLIDVLCTPKIGID